MPSFHLHCVSVSMCCSVLRCVALSSSVCCSEGGIPSLDIHGVCCSAFQSVLQCGLYLVTRYSFVYVLQHVAVCCSVFQSVLQCGLYLVTRYSFVYVLQHVAVCCSAFQSVLQCGLYLVTQYSLTMFCVMLQCVLL